MNVVLFDPTEIRRNLLPLTYTRPVADLRVGILTIREKWQKHLKTSAGVLTEEYLTKKYPRPKHSVEVLYINGALCPGIELVSAITNLPDEHALLKDGHLLAVKTSKPFNMDTEWENSSEYNEPVNLIQQPWHIFKTNASELSNDFDLLTKDRKSQPIEDPNTVVYNPEHIFLEEGASIKAAVLDASNGPIYIGRNATVHAGALINGAFALCEGAHVNMGAKIKGDTTIGPYSKVGGEVSNSVIIGYSNKGHDGFLGNSVIGEWCNLGADTNTSNLKNNYADVKIWDYYKDRFKNTGETFCGLIMGDHSKCGINTMFNTGTVVGVSANIFGAGFPRNFIPSFAWGGAQGFTTFHLRSVNDVAKRVMERRNIDYNATEQSIIEAIFELSAKYRIWDNDKS